MILDIFSSFISSKVYSQDLHIIQGKRVDTKSAHRRDQALARKVFVGGLDPEVSDVELREYFSKFGKVGSEFSFACLYIESILNIKPNFI